MENTYKPQGKNDQKLLGQKDVIFIGKKRKIKDKQKTGNTIVICMRNNF